ncbi:unnamed protein product [Arctia plantaginis]|uniref:Uncharacterized protein n=1 Tax=Arctia plantaginis TaxID=874455 RepID=A0A8S0Z4S3_ARCPL|nr:unnamed protein product [Arctia plantaginis]
MIKYFLEDNDPENLGYTLSLKTGCIFIASFGILLWCSDLLFDKRYKIVTYLNESRYKLLYSVVFTLYVTCILALIIHIIIHYKLFPL